jgi:protein subunit release factor A
MLEKLEQIEARYEALGEELSSPELIADQVSLRQSR